MTPMPAGRPPRRTDHIKHRNMVVQVLLFIVTLSLYRYYWYFVTLEELHTANGTEESGCLWTVLLLIPIANLFAYWHYSFQYAEFIDQKYPGIAIFILWIVFEPVVWVLAQMDLNRAASGGSPAVR